LVLRVGELLLLLMTLLIFVAGEEVAEVRVLLIRVLQIVHW
jgi:hypothetical protein